MPASLARACAAMLAVLALSACSRQSHPAPHAPQASGTLQVDGLQSTVSVARDEWGIPHITASNTEDLFFAQGFVQAQDRLFQMDLWKRAAQGRLAEVLGANFIQRDSMTRRIQFRGDYAREWASYGPDTYRIATAFTSGVNAWVRIARADLPEDFVAAGWAPEYWKPEDLLNRTDAFLASGNARDDLFRARLIAAVGSGRANELFPLPDKERATIDPGVDLSLVTFVVSDAVRRIGTPPFFVTLAGRVSDAPRLGLRSQGAASAAGARSPMDAPPTSGKAEAADAPLQHDLRSAGRLWLVDSAGTSTGKPFVGVSLNSRFAVPASRYLVHLTAPGWNVAGATAPWLPGVSIGHNDHVAWAMTPTAADTQDIFVEHVNPVDRHQVERDGRWVDMSVDYERLTVKGRERPLEYERQYTPNGVVVAQDKERNLVYTLRWSGTETGGAAELAALALDRATSVDDLGLALSHWKMPVAEFAIADTSGQIARYTAGRLPLRPEGAGHLPGAGWLSARTWRGSNDEPRRIDAAASFGIAAVEDLARVQGDVNSASARTLLALIDQIRVFPKEIESTRAELLAWDGRFDGKSRQETVYLRLSSALGQALAKRSGVPDQLSGEIADRLDVVSLLASAPRSWLGANPKATREQMLVDALAGAAQANATRASQPRMMTFEHPLAVFDEAKRRFNVGPFPLRGTTDTMFESDDVSGSVFRGVFDPAGWERSVVANGPGQSGAPASPHYDDLAGKWASGGYVNLAFATKSAAPLKADVLTLQP